MNSLSMQDFDLMRKTVLFTEEDEKYLRLSHGVLESQTDAVLDVWYGFVGSQPHLLHYFADRKTGQPDSAYLAAVRTRFKQWILDTAAAKYNQEWLDYQMEIGQRHHRSGKNRTDNVSAVEHIHYRYLPALIYPIFATLKPFLAEGGHSLEEVDKMHQAWLKSLLLQISLWSRAYTSESDW